MFFLFLFQESFQSQKKAPEDLDDDDAQLFKEDPQPIQKKNGSEEDEEEKKENISQNQEGSNSHNSEGAELNSDDDISEKSNYETKNTLYCYYEKVFSLIRKMIKKLSFFDNF